MSLVILRLDDSEIAKDATTLAANGSAFRTLLVELSYYATFIIVSYSSYVV